MLDDLYEKPSLRPNASVAILFSNNHLVRTGYQAPGMAASANIWRNNFHMQKGFGCYAPPVDLLNSAFRNQSRTLCKYLSPSTPGRLSGATCSLENQARYRNEDHPKVFRVDPASREIFVYDPSDTSFYAPLITSTGARRLPIAPLIVALYYDSPLAGSRTAVDVGDFLLDFDFTEAEFATYFDDDPALVAHTSLADSFPRMLTWARVSASRSEAATLAASGSSSAGAVAPLPPIPLPTSVRKKRSATVGTTTLTTSPPAGSFWWDAEQAVRQTLVAAGWTVIDKTRFGVGYDFYAWKSGITRYVEVKSSAGQCSPVLTENEYAEARKSRMEYVLAIVENFDPKAAVSIQWVPDPTSLTLSARQTMMYGLPRSKWFPKVRPSL